MIFIGCAHPTLLAISSVGTFTDNLIMESNMNDSVPQKTKKTESNFYSL